MRPVLDIDPSAIRKEREQQREAAIKQEELKFIKSLTDGIEINGFGKVDADELLNAKISIKKITRNISGTIFNGYQDYYVVYLNDKASYKEEENEYWAEREVKKIYDIITKIKAAKNIKAEQNEESVNRFEGPQLFPPD